MPNPGRQNRTVEKNKLLVIVSGFLSHARLTNWQEIPVAQFSSGKKRGHTPQLLSTCAWPCPSSKGKESHASISSRIRMKQKAEENALERKDNLVEVWIFVWLPGSLHPSLCLGSLPGFGVIAPASFSPMLFSPWVWPRVGLLPRRGPSPPDLYNARWNCSEPHLAPAVSGGGTSASTQRPPQPGWGSPGWEHTPEDTAPDGVSSVLWGSPAGVRASLCLTLVAVTHYQTFFKSALLKFSYFFVSHSTVHVCMWVLTEVSSGLIPCCGISLVRGASVFSQIPPFLKLANSSFVLLTTIDKTILL